MQINISDHGGIETSTLNPLEVANEKVGEIIEGSISNPNDLAMPKTVQINWFNVIEGNLVRDDIAWTLVDRSDNLQSNSSFFKIEVINPKINK